MSEFDRNFENPFSSLGLGPDSRSTCWQPFQSTIPLKSTFPKTTSSPVVERLHPRLAVLQDCEDDAPQAEILCGISGVHRPACSNQNAAILSNGTGGHASSICQSLVCHGNHPTKFRKLEGNLCSGHEEVARNEHNRVGSLWWWWCLQCAQCRRPSPRSAHSQRSESAKAQPRIEAGESASGLAVGLASSYSPTRRCLAAVHAVQRPPLAASCSAISEVSRLLFPEQPQFRTHSSKFRRASKVPFRTGPESKVIFARFQS